MNKIGKWKISEKCIRNFVEKYMKKQKLVKLFVLTDIKKNPCARKEHKKLIKRQKKTLNDLFKLLNRKKVLIKTNKVKNKILSKIRISDENC